MSLSEIRGRLALVTGASGGIGAACTEQLAQQGVRLALTYSTNQTAMNELVASLRSRYGDQQLRISTHQVDVGCPDQIEAMFEQIDAYHGHRPDILISNAGYGKCITQVWDIGLEEFDKMMNINLRASFILVKGVVEHMKSERWGRIVFMSSIAAYGGGINGRRYAASKAGLTGMMKNLATRLAEYNISVNDVAPAMIGNTGMIANAAAVPEVVAGIPLGRLGTPEEIANVSVYPTRESKATCSPAFSVSGQALLPCGYCKTTFSRPDLRHRHVKRKHPEHELRRSTKHARHLRDHRANDNSNIRGKTGSSANRPAINDAPGPGEIVPDVPELDWDILLGASLLAPALQNQKTGSPSPLSNVNPTSFLFDADLADEPLPRDLTRHGEDPECNNPAGSGAILSTRCFNQARSIIAFDNNMLNDPTQSLAIVQSYLLLQICAMMFMCGGHSANGLKMHSNMISLARSAGLMQPSAASSLATEDLDSLWPEFIQGETPKRTLFTVHQIDALWCQLLSVPRSISQLEIKHDLPCPEDHWTASSSAEWAHRQLISRYHPGSSVQYADAIRRFLSPDGDLASIPRFDPFGAINIAHFLISSAREISGWSTMTGMLSMERFGALRNSLVALSPFLCQRGHEDEPTATTTATTPAAVSYAAVWESAMLELQMWSPLHTGGVVGASIDAWLSQSTQMALSPCEVLCEADTAQAVQPHVDWFLRYLDTMPAPESEAPWITLHAYRAFLIALQLVRNGVPGAMQVVGVEDGHEQGALEWARNVFRGKERWQIGRLIAGCLDGLSI
ncbi:hypothetical protein CNMCM6805_010442 [Aspergillus fumigatiaffinis]|uniref:C2H2-type domain-containing protein n=1 Tax=Aspergillus fumigatiaffinis TaxID=340414 RepID=A0A8H4HHH5_9EURO|nr:hypothetical protein CNMCM6805_010442 [Aspergillus fumigatiaffinis]